MSWDKWNELVDASNRVDTTKKNSRKSSITKPTHIVIHITGTDNYESVKNRFLNESASAHYLIKTDGTIVQFVRDKDRAWHAGIPSHISDLYDQNDACWKKYLKYFNWYTYPAGSKFLKGDLSSATTESDKKLVTTQDGTDWNYFSYWTKHGTRNYPVNFENNKDPNDYSIGIELLTTGGTSKGKYADGLYTGLITLLKDLCDKYDIPKDHNYIVGHEDVNPVERWGWDPNSGFEWDRVFNGLGSEEHNAPVDLGAGLKPTPAVIDSYYNHTEKETEGGYFPVGSNTLWHGGLHIFKDEGTEVFACMPGKVIAGRLADDNAIATGPFGHRNFLLLEHTIKEKKCFSLYIHLKDNPLSESDEFVKKVKWLQGGGKKSYKITGETRNYRSSTDSSSDANKLGSLKKGDVVELVEDASPAPWKKVKLSDSKEVFLSCDPKYVEECTSVGIDNELLESLKKGDVVIIDKEIQAGDLLWKMGKYGPKEDQKGLVHWEIFSEENLVAGLGDGWTSIEDPDDDFNAENDTISQFFGDLMADGTLTREELKQFYSENPEGKVDKLRSFACKFASEWGVKDLAAAVTELKKMGFSAKEDDYKPYLWWTEAVSAGVALPSPHVWHYNPIRFLEVFGPSQSSPVAQPAPQAQPAAPVTVGVKKCEGPETVDVLEKGTFKVSEFNGTPSAEQKKNISWVVYINGEERRKFEKCGDLLEFDIPDTWAGDEITVHPYINKPSQEIKVVTKVGPYFLFDGKELAAYSVKCTKGVSWSACSGEDGVTDQSKEHGPIPEGKYLIEKSNIQALPGMMDRMFSSEWDGGADYWGEKRLQVFSFGAKTFGRNRFYVHGGKKKGSGFGIDLTDKIEDFISLISAWKRDKVVLVVRTTAAPAANPSTIPQATDNVHTDWKLGFNRDISKQNEFNDFIYKHTKDTTVNPYIFKSLIAQESAFKKEAHNKMGYAGLTQIGNSTIADSGLTIAGTKRVTKTEGKEVKKVWEYDLENDERFKPEKSIEAGVKILKKKMDSVNNNVFSKYTVPATDEEKWKFYLAAYNGGEGTVKKAYIACKVTNATWDDIIKGKEASALWGAIPEAWGREGKYKEISTYPLEILKRAKQDGSIGAGSGTPTTNTTSSTTESAKTDSLKKGNYDDVAVKKYSSKKASGTGYVAGSKVEKLQKDLTTVGFTEIGTADGDFGQKTEDCLKKFQEYALKDARKISDKEQKVTITFKGKADGVAEKVTLDEVALWISKGYQIPQKSTVSVDKLTINYSGSITHISDKAEKVLKKIMQEASVDSVIITSTVRTPEDQARIMYDNIVVHGVSHQKNLYGTNGDLVIDEYSSLKKANKKPDEIKKGMKEKIISLGSTTISKHCCDPTEYSIFDVAPSSIPGDKKGKFESAIKSAKSAGSIQKYFFPPEDPAYHIEVKL